MTRSRTPPGVDCTPTLEELATTFYYPLSPAGYWAGNPSQVRVKVDLGPWSVVRKKSTGLPADVRSRGNELSWAWKDPDLKQTEFSLSLAPDRDKARGLWLLGYNRGDLADGRCRPAADKIAVEASSHIAATKANRYGPENLVDGDLATAWCVNTAAHGVGEWVELRIPINPAVARFGDLAIAPVYAKSPTLMKQNGSVKKMSWGPCGDSGRKQEILLRTPKAVGDGLVEILGSSADLNHGLARDGRVCLRFEIREVVRGRKYDDVCMSEIVVPQICH